MHWNPLHVGTGRSRFGRPARALPLVAAVAAAVLQSLLAVVAVEAAYLRDFPVTVTQPDGSILSCYVSGDEYFHWAHDAAGYVIVQDPASGRFVYARSVQGELVPSEFVAGTVDPGTAGLIPNVRIPRSEYYRRVEQRMSLLRQPDGSMYHAPVSGELNNLVVFLRFNDESEFGDQVSEYNALFNLAGASDNSMYHYYKDATYDQLSIITTFCPTSTGAVVSYQYPTHSRSWCQPYSATNTDGYNGEQMGAERLHTVLQAAVNGISAQVPQDLNLDSDSDGKVDNVCFVLRGSPDTWYDMLWPHMWALTLPAYIHSKQVYIYNLQLQNTMPTSGVGVLCHEMFHSLGAPDLYHYQEQYNYLAPVGSWDLMEGNTNPPQHMTAYMKFRYGGWISSIPAITQTGTYTLSPMALSAGNCYRIASPNSTTQFYVVEYRRQSASMFEGELPGSGLIVYRIDTSQDGLGNRDGPPDEVYVYRPGGSTTQNGSPDQAYYSAASGRTAITDQTSPSGYLTNGSPGGLEITQIGSAGATISFHVTVEGGGPGTCQTQTGDATGDNTVNVLDVVATVNDILQTTQLGEQGRVCADMDNNSTINVLDVVAIVNKILHPLAVEVHDQPAGSPREAAAPPVAWSEERTTSAYSVALDGSRLGGLQATVILPPESAPASEPILHGASAQAEIAWSRHDGRLVVVVYNPSGDALADGWMTLTVPGAQQEIAGSDPNAPLVQGLVLADPRGRPLSLADRPETLRPGVAGVLPQVWFTRLAPNPAMGRVGISYELRTGGAVHLAVFDPSGRRIRTLWDGWQPAGGHGLTWEGTNDQGIPVSPGVYFLRLSGGGARDSQRLLVIR